MILQLIQNRKDLFAAQFEIRRGENVIGNVFLKGNAGTNEAHIQGNFYEMNFEMKREKCRNIEAKSFRPYVVRQENAEIGAVYQTQHKLGIFKHVDFIQMTEKEKTYDLFPMSFGDEGGKCPVYCGQRQIAQIEKDCVVYNDLHEYQIFAEDEKSGFLALVFSLYMYVNACYKPGEKAYSSKSKTFSVTKEEYLLEKYSPYFKNHIGE